MESIQKNRKKKRVLSVLFALVFLAFVGVLDYPFISRLYNERVQGNIVMDYEQAVEEQDDQEAKAERLRAQEYNRELAGSKAALSDAFQGTRQEESGYHSLLGQGEEGIMGVVRIPVIDLELPIYHGTSEEVLQKGAGHLEGTSLPAGGTDTHTCISAHRGLPNKVMFTNLDQLKEGDLFYLDVLKETLAYEIFQIETVEPWDTEALAIREGEDLATLITCTPYGLNTHRLYLHGRRVAYVESGEAMEQDTEASAPVSIERNYWYLLKTYGWIAVTVVLLLWLVFLLYQFNRDPDRKRIRAGDREEERTEDREQRPGGT